MLYIRLFHGRTDPNQDMDDWGSDGPVLGPYKFVHTTYAYHIKLGKPDDDCDELFVYEDMLYYDGIYYGDWSVFDEETFKEAQFEATQFEQAKAELPKHVNS
jgi:hypothetical protein